MNLLKQPLSVCLLLACSSAIPVSAADIKAGEQKSAICAGCHGPNGKSANSQWPNLAAQQPEYIINQLEAFKSGDRTNPMMQGMAANLSSEDMANLAAYFAGQSAAQAEGDPTLEKAGEAKAALCLGCHGQKAAGNAQIPRLAGQHPEYLVTQLKNFKSGARKSGPMPAVAGNLSEEDMKALAAYFGSL